MKRIFDYVIWTIIISVALGALYNVVIMPSYLVKPASTTADKPDQDFVYIHPIVDRGDKLPAVWILPKGEKFFSFSGQSTLVTFDEKVGMFLVRVGQQSPFYLKEQLTTETKLK